MYYDFIASSANYISLFKRSTIRIRSCKRINKVNMTEFWMRSSYLSIFKSQ